MDEQNQHTRDQQRRSSRRLHRPSWYLEHKPLGNPQPHASRVGSPSLSSSRSPATPRSSIARSMCPHRVGRRPRTSTRVPTTGGTRRTSRGTSVETSVVITRTPRRWRRIPRKHIIKRVIILLIKKKKSIVLELFESQYCKIKYKAGFIALIP